LIVLGILSVIWWAMFRYLSERSTTRNRISSESKPTLNKLKSSDAALLPLEKKKQAIDTDVPWRQLFSHPAFWAASVAQYAGANAYFTIFSWLPSYFNDHFPNAKVKC
jgi:hypothetical protein